MSDVKLTVTLKNGHLDVAQIAQVDPGKGAKITWFLHLTGRDGSFNTLCDPNGPGFAWRETPKGGVFGDPEVKVHEKKITLIDKHTGPRSAGIWIYQLCATIDGDPYSTIYVPGAVTK